MYKTTDFIADTSFSMTSKDGKVLAVRANGSYNIYYHTNEDDYILFAENIETLEFCPLLDIINDLVPEYKQIYDN